MPITNWFRSFGSTRWSGFQRTLLGFIIFASLTDLAIDVSRIWTGNDRAIAIAIADSNRYTANLVFAIAQNADDTFRIVVGALGQFVERFENDGSGDAAVSRMRHFLTARPPAMSEIMQISFADAQGSIVVSSAPRAVNIADMSFFRFHRDHPDRISRISTMSISYNSSSAVIPVTQRVNHPDGSFAGVFLAEIHVDYLLDYYSTFDIGKLGSIGLVSSNGILMVRWPFDPARLNMDLSKTPVFRAVKQGGPVGSIAGRSPFDDTDRLISYRRLGTYPLTIVLSLQVDEALTRWREDVIFDIIKSIAIALLIAMFGILFLRRASQLTTTLATFAEREREYRLLADHSSDMVMHIVGGIRVYVSPACRQLIQFEPEELIGQPTGNLIHPDDRVTWSAGMERLDRTGDMEQTTYRLRRRDGVYIWVEVYDHRLPDDQGHLAVVRDISARKAAEFSLLETQAALEAANERLESLAHQDALTGLSNRRHFDEALEIEHRRAMRDATPLALILIDIDHFKPFNDRYGHPRGDDCLRRVSRVIAQLSARPGDMTARYGGEELVTLLPNTSQSGALAVAERMLDAVRNLRIAHDSSPHGIVTVSIGVASVVPPIPGATLSDALVEAADRMLYAAKRDGRNRIFPPPGDHIRIGNPDLMAS